MKFRRSRSRRSGQNQNNITSKNHVFESSGPDGKIRGTAQQLYEKYTSRARDFSSGLNSDRILAENYSQHADHYYRILLEIRLAESQNQARFQENRLESKNDFIAYDQQDEDDDPKEKALEDTTNQADTEKKPKRRTGRRKKEADTNNTATPSESRGKTPDVESNIKVMGDEGLIEQSASL